MDVGLHHAAVAAALGSMVAVGDNSSRVAVGDNGNVLPTGAENVAVAAGVVHTVLLRNDGTATKPFANC